MSLALNVRPQRAGDVAFVMATWLEQYASSAPSTKHINRATFFGAHRPIIEGLIGTETAPPKPGVRVLVAVDPKDDDVIYGWLATERMFDGASRVHFAYVKMPFRKAGVLTRLLAAAEVDMENSTLTHWTYSCSEMSRNHSLSYNPYLLWET